MTSQKKYKKNMEKFRALVFRKSGIGEYPTQMKEKFITRKNKGKNRWRYIDRYRDR
jgi:hypothetical protein